MSAALLPRLRAAGADALLRDGRLIVSGAGLLPPGLLAEAKARRDDLQAEVVALANDNAAPLVAVTCATCGKPGSFLAVTNPDLWRCAECLPAVVDEIVERAAIQAEHLPVQRTRKRMTSWAQADDEPQPGDHCGCCSGSLWWSDTDPPRGWCCCRCHPPVHLQAGQFRVVAT